MAAAAGAGAGEAAAAAPTTSAGAAASDDRDLHDDLIDGMAAWSPEERSKYLSGLDEHPLFMETSPTVRRAPAAVHRVPML